MKEAHGAAEANNYEGKGHGATGSPPAFHYLFGDAARRFPDNIALVDGDNEDSSLTYRQLDECTDTLAMRLADIEVGRGSVVGVYMERSAEYVIAMIAAMKAGASFLPLELAYPKSMISDVLSDAEPNVILTKSIYEPNLPASADTIRLDDNGIFRTTGSGTEPEFPHVSADDLVFIAYSSGTTGKPKGIANPHRAAVGSYLWRFGIDAPKAGSRVGCNVFFIWEVLRPLLIGATSVIIPDDVIYDPRSLVDFLSEYEVTETLMTPSLLETVLNQSEESLSDSVPKLETLWLNGEVVTRVLVRRAAYALPHTRLLNVYSISEAHEVAAGDLRKLADNPHSTYCPVGKPMDAGLVEVLDDGMRPVPDGEAGELYIGGDWLACEYLNLPEKTAERFTEDIPGRRVYRSGDRARILPGGELEILGRCDFMVKVRGYSIELGAVENAIESSLPVKSCCVTTDGEEGEDKRLVAYLVPSDEADENLPEIHAASGRSTGIREILKESLPHYAIPSVYISLDGLPLQETTGKVDRTRLPEPPRKSSGDETPSLEDITMTSEPTRQELENAVCRVFEAVLSFDEGDVLPGDDFFEIGGHSLAAAEATGALEKVFGTSLSVGDFLQSATPKDIATRLDSEDSTPTGNAHEATIRAMISDSVLDDEIHPTSRASVSSLGDAKKVLFTGATGFLGAFLVRRILDLTSADVVCLVRSKGDSSSLMSKVRDNLGYYGLWESWMEKRLSGVAGNLGSRNLGMSDEDYRRVAGDTDIVLHAGASVNLIYPYDSLRQPNVEGTREVLRLCSESHTKPLIHISTNGVFPPDFGNCSEDADLDSLRDGIPDGYGQSKWVAEKLVREAGSRGIPVCVFRPGNISGHSTSGASNPSDLLSALFDACLRMQSAPDIPEWRIEMSPVDFVAAAIVEISSRPESFGGTFGKTFHLANPSPPLASDVLDLLEDPESPLQSIPLDRWMEDLSQLEGAKFAKSALSGNPEHLFSPDSNRHHERNTREVLDGSDVSRPKTDARLLRIYREFFQKSHDFAAFANQRR